MKAARMDKEVPSLNLHNNAKSSSTQPPHKRLIFDRRYGFVIDLWQDPSEEALSGGRGMFCIVPLAKGLITAASETINLAASSTLKVLEKPELFSSEVLRLNMLDQLQRFMSSVKKPEINTLLKRSQAFSSNPNAEGNELHNV